jgi:hypothetical protein
MTNYRRNSYRFQIPSKLAGCNHENFLVILTSSSHGEIIVLGSSVLEGPKPALDYKNGIKTFFDAFRWAHI